MSHGSASGLRRGVVVSFDDSAGYGMISATGSDPDCETAEEWFFHCSAIADGSRGIVQGTRVVCRVVAGHMGRFEATDIRPV